MINFETFKKLNTEEKFNLFEKVCQQNVKLNNLLENVTMRLDTHEKKLNDILRNQETNQVNNEYHDTNEYVLLIIQTTLFSTIYISIINMGCL